VAKTKMICPFSGDLCKNCPLYRGRHYYLCFNRKYRGCLYEPGEVSKTVTPPTSGSNPNQKFEIPHINPKNAIDPYAIIAKEREEELI